MRTTVILIFGLFVGACFTKEIRRHEMLDINTEDDSVSNEVDFGYDVDLGLSFPRDCKANKLKQFAVNCGLTVTAGGNHWVVKDPKTNTLVTTIPHSVSENDTCRGIINALNRKCYEF